MTPTVLGFRPSSIGEGLGGAHVGSAQISQLYAAEERRQVVGGGPLVAREGTLAHLVAGCVGEPAPETPRP